MLVGLSLWLQKNQNILLNQTIQLINYIFGCSDGGVYVQNLIDKSDYYIDKAENTFTCSVDISPDGLVVASGMRNDCFKIFSLHRDPLGMCYPYKNLIMN